MKVRDAIAQALKAEGVEYLVCYPRQALIDSCAEAGIHPIVCRQERVGSSIADGISRSTNGRKIGVFAMQGGPGTENAFAGVAQAFADNVPVLYLSGGTIGRSHTPPAFRAVENFRNVTKWLAEIDQPGRVSELMRRAFHQMRSGKPGPVLIDIPMDAADAEIPGEFNYTPVRAVRCAPDPADIRIAVDFMLKARFPVIQAGQGVLYAGATQELVRLAETLQAPVYTTNTGKSAFPENHPLSLGASVVSAPKALKLCLDKADLVIGIGTSFSYTPWGPQVPSGKRIVHATTDPSDINKEHFTEAPILGDAKLVLEAMLAEIGDRKRDGGAMLKEVEAIKREWLAEWQPELISSEVPINQYRIVHELKRLAAPENTIITHDSGSPREQLVPFWEAVTPRGYLGWGKSTQLGHGLGLIMGAKLAHPEKLCINVMGDAAIGMVGMDLETASRNRIGILTIVFNNGVMACERASMPKATNQYNALDLGGNYSEVAHALGGWGTRVETPEAFAPALERAIGATRTGVPALIECVVKENYKFSRY